jgi:hypothetical protein
LDIHLFRYNGNLLPSNSGAPIFNKQGKLVGIGNGGLEKGTVNISWAIPAKYISELEKFNHDTDTGNGGQQQKPMFSSTVFSRRRWRDSIEEIYQQFQPTSARSKPRILNST